MESSLSNAKLFLDYVFVAAKTQDMYQIRPKLTLKFCQI